MQATLAVVMGTAAVRPLPFLTVSLKACFHSRATGRLSQSSISTQALVESAQLLRSPPNAATASSTTPGPLSSLWATSALNRFSSSKPFPAQPSHRLRKVSDSVQNPRDSVYLPETLGQQPERCLSVVLRSHHYNANLS